ncbi:MAG: hypothetical protein RLZZ611_940 [Cyanobacteriota bacterium]|jgi:hypothetical protein
MGGPWRWAALLGFALIAPVSLPAGGAERRQPEVRRRQPGEPLLPTSLRSLQASPERQAPVLARLSADQPLRVLRSWRGAGGERWLQVETGGGGAAAPARRGWLLA